MPGPGGPAVHEQVEAEGGGVADIELQYAVAFFFQPVRVLQDWAADFITNAV